MRLKIQNFRLRGVIVPQLPRHFRVRRVIVSVGSGIIVSSVINTSLLYHTVYLSYFYFRPPRSQGESEFIVNLRKSQLQSNRKPFVSQTLA